MKNFTTFLLIAFVLCACNKETEFPNNNPPGPPPSPPATPAPVTTVTININGLPMTITSLSYYRQASGLGGIWITAANDLQKVTAVASPFDEFGSEPYGGYVCKVEVSYFTRSDNGSGWGVTNPRLVPRDDKILFNECTPLRAKVLTGNFSGSFTEPSSSPKEGDRIYITGNFSLVF